MGGGKREDLSIEATIDVLRVLGCPNPRRGEGSDEWERSKGSFRFTPDLIAGRLVGAGSAIDFYIDVLQPTGDQYVKPKAGSPQAAGVLANAVAARGSFVPDDLRDDFAALYGPVSNKLRKYSGERGGSPMVGLVTYFRVGDNQYVGPIIGHIQTVIGLDRAFGLTEKLGQDAVMRLQQSLFGQGDIFQIAVLPIAQSLTFVLWLVEKRAEFQSLMLVNDSVLTDARWQASSVIKWLCRLKGTPDPILQEQIRSRLNGLHAERISKAVGRRS